MSSFDRFINRCAFGPDVEVEVKVVHDVPATTAIVVIEMLEWLVDSEEPIQVVDATDTMRQAIALLRGEQS